MKIGFYPFRTVGVCVRVIPLVAGKRFVFGKSINRAKEILPDGKPYNKCGDKEQKSP
jgi:hypothetical protein